MKNRKILVIEDNSLSQKLVKIMLSKEPYILLFTKTAEEGLKLAREEIPDLILMDIRLPGMDGLEATRQVRKDRLLRDCLVIAFSAGAMRGDREKALAAGCDGYISKPVRPRVFIEKIARYLATWAEGKGQTALPAAPRVLLVSDSLDTSGTLIAQLSGDAVTLETSPLGPGAMVKARAWLPEAVIIDSKAIQLALRLLKEFKESKELARIPCLVASNRLSGANRAKLLQAGATSLLEEPASAHEFRTRLNQTLGTRQRARQHRLRVDAARACGISAARSRTRHQIMVVEKEPVASRILEYGLRGLGCKIVVAATVAAARSSISEGGIDLISLDTSVPDCDGHRLVEQLTTAGGNLSAPVMVLSSVADAATRARAFEQGVAEFLVKPVTDVEMCTYAERLLTAKMLIEQLRYLGKDISLPIHEIGAIGSQRDFFFHSLLEFCLQSAIANRHPLAVAIICPSRGSPAPPEWAVPLRGICRDVDWFGRLGDGTFAVVFTHLGSEAAKLLDRFKRGFEGNPPDNLTDGGIPQFGLAVYPQDGTHGSQLLEKANAQLHGAAADS
jgi:CheY-like chemotaxis protein